MPIVKRKGVLLVFLLLAFLTLPPLIFNYQRAFASDPYLKPMSGYPIENFREGQEIPPDFLSPAVSLSAGNKLFPDNTYNLFFSNVPEMPTDPGVLCRVDDVLPPSGMVRILFSHLNLLIDWSGYPLENMPAKAGFAVENRTGRTLDVYAVRGAMAVSRAPDGAYLFTEDAAPLRPGESEPLYYGSAVGNHVVREWFLSEERPPVMLGRVEPGRRLTVSADVGPRGWAAGIYDLEFVDAGTGRQFGRNDCTDGEAVGLETFLAPPEVDLEFFLDQCLASGEVLPLGANDCEHMRGLFVPGFYPDNPDGEAVSKSFTVTYPALERRIASFALASGDLVRNEGQGANDFEADTFLNDRMRSGFDPAAQDKKGVNKGNYGVDYTINLQFTGPVALVLQGALQNGFVDACNQIITFWLDGQVKTVRILDPNYDKFYTDPTTLRPAGYGHVIGVYPDNGRHDHLLRFTLPPNNYGPVRFYLVPLSAPAS